MAPPRIRMTMPTRMILDALAHADPAAPLWGYKLTELTGLGSGTVYPILERLERGKYVSATVEKPKPEDRPPRRFYQITGSGLELAASAKRAPTSRPLFRLTAGPGRPA